MIEMNGVGVRRGGRDVLRDITLTVRAGAVAYLLGRNGAGKSTLLRVVAGIDRPTSGTVRVAGLPPGSPGRAPETFGLHLGPELVNPGHTVCRHLRMVAAGLGLGPRRADAVMEEASLREVATLRVASLSLGWRQRVSIAAALLPQPKCVVFDEPLNGLDIDGQLWFRSLARALADNGAAVLIASHHLHEVARSADRIAALDGGRLVTEASSGEFLAGAADIEEAYLARVSGAGPTKGEASGSGPVG